MHYRKLTVDKVNLYSVGGSLRIKDLVLTKVYDVSLTIIRKFIRQHQSHLEKIDEVVQVAYSKRGKQYSRFMLSYSQFDTLCVLLNGHSGLHKKFNGKQYLRVTHAFYKANREEALRESRLRLESAAQPSDFASFSAREEELRQQIILDDLPQALYHLIGNPDSPMHREIMATIASIIDARFQSFEREIQSKVRRLVSSEVKRMKFRGF